MDNRFLRPLATLKWLLRDEFYTTLAAGSVNGTAAEPGPGGNRTVVDTNSKLSIASGALAVATGGGGSIDPRVYYDSITRAAGLLVVVESNIATEGVRLGWTRANDDVRVGAMKFASTSVYVDDDDGDQVVVGVFSTGTVYYIASVLRATGTYFFIKGGAFTNWELLYVSGTRTNTPMIPIIAADDNASVFTNSFLRVPDALWLPQPELSDGFAAANGTKLNTLSSDGLGHAEGVTGGIGAGGSGLAWSDAPDTYTIQTNKAINTPVAGSEVMTDGGMEGSYSTTGTLVINDDWVNNGLDDGVDSAEEDTVVFNGGASSQKVTADASNEGIRTAANVFTDNLIYHIAISAYDTAGSIRATDSGGAWLSHSMNPGASWTDYVATGIATTTGALRFLSVATGATFNVDDVSVKALTLSELLALQLFSTQDGIMDADLVVVAGTQAGVAMNWDSPTSPANGIVAYHDGVSAKLYKNVAGTWTIVINAVTTYSANAKIRVIKSGTTYSLFYNGAAVGAASTISDAGIVSNKYHGLFNTYASNTINDAIFRPRGTSGEYARLDRYIKG